MNNPLVLLDTNVVLTLVRGNELASFIDAKFELRTAKARPLVSVVSHGEVRVLAGRNGWGQTKDFSHLGDLLHVEYISPDSAASS